MTEWLAFFSRHPMLSAAFFGLLLAWIIYEFKQARKGYSEVGNNALSLLVNREQAALIDVSANKDFDKQHIAGARNMPFDQFDPSAKEVAKLKGQAVVVCCRDGLRSADACKRLIKAGYPKVYLLKGGVGAWAGEQLPLVKGRN